MPTKLHFERNGYYKNNPKEENFLEALAVFIILVVIIAGAVMLLGLN